MQQTLTDTPPVEQNRARAILYRQLMNVPHRDLGPIVEQLTQALQQDPDFIARACVHIASGGSNIRDQQEAAIITLLQAPPDFPEYREAGRVLALGSEVYITEPESIAGLEPYRLFRIVIATINSSSKVPRLLRGIMTDYTHWLETQPTRFDGVVMRNRRRLKEIYIRYHLKPGTRAQAILFDNNPPSDSKLAILKQIANSDDDHHKARLIIEHDIPYVIATSVLPKLGPESGVALISAMSPQEALNSRKWVEQSNLLAIPEVRQAYEAKVAQATTSVATARHRRSAQGQDASIQVAVEQAATRSVQKAERIDGAVLIMVDRSASMGRAIQVAQEFGARIAPLCPDRMIVAFNDYAQEIKPDGDDLQAHERAFRGILPGGATSMQAGLELALRQGFFPDKIVIITDGGENRGTSNRMGSYAHHLSAQHPTAHTIVIGVSNDSNGNYYANLFTQSIEAAGLRADLFEFKDDDYYLFDQITALLAQSGGASLIEQILQTELPRRVRCPS